MKHHFRVVLIFVLLAMLLNGAAFQPVRANLPTHATLAGDPKVNALIAKAEQTGSLPVIVGLNVPFQPEGKLSSPQASSQVNKIKTAQAGMLKQLESRLIKNVKKFEHVPAIAFTLDADGLRLLQTIPEVISIIEDRPVKVSLAESTKLIQALPTDTGGYTGAGWAVAVLDTGVDKTHPFLAGKVVSEACYSTTDADYGSESVCPGGVAKSTAPGSGMPCSLANGCFHGTHVAGIAAGKGSSFSGVARDAQIIAVQVFSDLPPEFCDYISHCPASFPSDQILALEQVYKLSSTYKIASVNLSLGGGTYWEDCDYVDPTYKDAIDNLLSVGIATVAAAGNEYNPEAIAAPACFSNVYSVGSVGDGTQNSVADQISDFSNLHAIMEFFAPGEEIISSLPGGKYDSLNGTSMASPHVAGAWALLHAREPNATTGEIYTALSETGKAIPFDYQGETITRPRIKVGPAVTRLHELVKPSIGFSTATYSVNENAGAVTITVKLSRAYSDTVTVNYATSNGTAIAGQDYTAASGTLTFTPGQVSKTFSVSITNDSSSESNETVNLTLSNVVNATAGTLTATLTLVDDDSGAIQVKFNQSSYTVMEDSSLSITVQLSAASTSTVTVQYATSNGTATAGQDYTATSGTLTFTPGQIQKIVDVSVANDTLDEEDTETVNLTLSNPTGANLGSPSSAILNITDNDPSPTISFKFSDSGYWEDAGNSEVIVKLSAASGRTITADFATKATGTATAGQDFIATSGELTFPPGGDIEQKFEVAIVDDTLNEADETIDLQLTNLVHTGNTGPVDDSITIHDNDPLPSVSFQTSTLTVNETALKVIADVQLSPASGRPVTIHYATQNGTALAGSDYTSASGQIVFAAGETHKTITIPIINDTGIESNENFTISLTLPEPSTAEPGTYPSLTVTIVSDDTDTPGEWKYFYLPSLSR